VARAAEEGGVEERRNLQRERCVPLVSGGVAAALLPLGVTRGGEREGERERERERLKRRSGKRERQDSRRVSNALGLPDVCQRKRVLLCPANHREARVRSQRSRGEWDGTEHSLAIRSPRWAAVGCLFPGGRQGQSVDDNPPSSTTTAAVQFPGIGIPDQEAWWSPTAGHTTNPTIARWLRINARPRAFNIGIACGNFIFMSGV